MSSANNYKAGSNNDLYIVPKNTYDGNDSSKDIVDNQMTEKSNPLTQNDLWQSHNSLRDEQHRQEDRIARQLADSEQRITAAFDRVSRQILHSEKELRKDIRQLHSKIDGQNDKIKAFANKNTIWIATGILSVFILAAAAIVVKFFPTIDYVKLKDVAIQLLQAYSHTK